MKTTTRTTIVRSALTVLVTIVALAACNNPFQVGLGENVDIDRPVISLESPDLGSFLRGTVTFAGAATDDVSVTSVSISFDRGGTWTSVDDYSAAQDRWSYALDTTARANGRLGVLVRVTDDSGKQATTEELLFTVDNEAPSIFFTFPAVNPDNYDENNPPTVGKNGAIFGTVTDRDAIGLDSPSIKFWRVEDTEPTAWSNLRPGDTTTPSVYDFKYSIPTEEVGEFFMKVQAQDIGGQTSATPTYKVVVVSGAPQVDITSPNQADYVRSLTPISGTMSHETGQEPVITLEFYERENPTPLLSVAKADGISVTPNGNAFDWSYDIDTSSLPNGTIIAQSFAQVGDTVGFDSVVFNVDNEAPTVTVTSPGYKETVYSTITLRGIASDNATLEPVSIKIGADPYDTPGDSYNWSYVFDTNLYGNTTHAEEWDPLADVAASGTGIWRLPILIRALDGAGSETIEEHILFIDQDLDKPTVNILSPLSGSNLAGPVLVTGTAFDADPGVDRVEMQIIAVSDADDVIGYLAPDGSALTSADWHVVDGTSQWSREINSNGLLYSVTDPGQAYEGSTYTHNGRLQILVRAVDAGAKEGNAQTLPIRLDETIPTIANVSPASNSYVTGSFALTADISDDEEITSVAVSYDGGTTYDTVYSGAGAGLKSYPLNELIDTTASGLNILSESRNLRIRVRDNANYTTITTVTLNIDNYWPDASLDAAPNDPENMNDVDFELRGEAWDRDRGVADNQYPVRGIGSVEIYFEDLRSGSSTSGEFYSISGGATAVATLSDLGNLQGSQPVVASADHKIVITRDDVGSEDGKAIEPELSDSIWYALVDSSNLPDGEMQVHYLVTDRAGNQTHRSEPGFVKNNPPVVAGLTVGTDLDYSGAVEPVERFAYGSTRFKARGLIYIEPSVIGGNGSPSYEVFESSDLGTPLTISGDAIDISNSGVYPDGDYTFVVRVTDDVGISIEESFLVEIDQQDTVDPSISIALEPVAATGHVETSSPYNAGRPALSGMVTVSGSASDNQRIQEILLTAPGVGTNVLAASWVGGATNNLVSQLAGFTIDSNNLSEDTGQTITWSYTWDTADHPSVAATGVAFGMSVQDFRAGSPAPIAASRTYDIVPYITDLEVGMESGTLSFLRRSAGGAWSIANSNSAADTFRIHGYNLSPLAGDVTIGTSALTIESSDTVDFTWVDARKNSTNSGPLTLTTSGVDSINNVNNNGLARNQEATTYFPDRTDDRVLRVWSLESKTALSGVTEAVMHPNAGRTDMDWLYANNGQQLVLNTTTLTNSWSLKGGDMARNDSGTLLWIFLHNMNWNSGQTSYSFFGSVQWGKDEANEAFAPNWHRAGTDRLGLGNLSFDGDANYPYSDPVMDRYRNLRILTDGTDGDTDNYVAYFDSAAESRSIVFWSFKTGNNLAGGDQVTALAGGWDSNLEKFTEGNTGGNYAVPGNTDIGLRTPSTGIGRVEVTSAGADSEHFSMAWDDANGILYLAYYDETSSELKLAYNLDPIASPGTWITRATSIDTGAGLYVETTVDPDGGVHLAYFDGTQSNLKYAYLPSHDVVDAGVERYTVDALFTNGMYNSIAIRDFDDTAGTDYRPVISSFSLSYSGTPYAIRTSWPVAPIGFFADGAHPGTGNYTGDWEVVTVPAATPPGPVRTFVETDGTAAHEGRILVGYNGGYIEEATLLDE